MSNPRAIRKRRAERGQAPADPCRFGCQSFRPVACEAVDPFTVRMTATCVACGRDQTRVGRIESGEAESFAAQWVSDRTMHLGAKA